MTTPLNSIVAAGWAPFASDPVRLKQLNEDRVNNPEKFQKTMLAAIGEWFMLQHDAMYHPLKKQVQEKTKQFNALLPVTKNLGTFEGRTISVFQSFLDELAIDMDWMKAYRMVDLQGTSRADILDFTGVGGWAEIAQGKDIEVSPWGTESFSDMTEKRYAIGRMIFNRWLETNSVYNINAVFQTIASGRLTFMANTAYKALANATGVTVNNATGSTVKDVITAINASAAALLKANSNKDFALSKSTRLILYYNYTHGDIMDEVINMKRATDGANNTNRVVRFNIEYVETWNENFPAQLESSKAGGMLVLPRLKNLWGTFKPLSQETKYTFGTDSTNVKAQEYWNHQEPTVQRQVVRFEA